jgi:hypothetical protein
MPKFKPGEIMKKLFVLFLLGLICQINAAQVPVTTDQGNSAIIYFFRLPSYSGSAVKMTIMSNDQPIVRLKNASYFKYTVSPGNYVFSLSFGSESKLSLNAEAGKEYYFKCYLNVGMWSGIPIIEPVDPASGKMIIEGNRLSELSTEPISTEPRNSRLGILLSAGFGFDKYPFFTDENGDDVTLSTGGGFGIGAEYGHQFGRVFDLSLNAFFQSSGLSRSLSNASATFNRFGLTVTPALVIPLKSDDRRFRIGAGPGIYALGTMKVDASEIDFTKYTFKYKPAIGFHALFLFETKFMERGSMNIGIRYNRVTYEYTPEGSSHQVSDPELLNSDGSAIDFIWGFNLLF